MKNSGLRNRIVLSDYHHLIVLTHGWLMAKNGCYIWGHIMSLKSNWSNSCVISLCNDMVTLVSTPSSSNIWNRTSDYGQGEIKSPQITPILLSQWPNPQNSFVGRNKSFPPPEHKANIKFVPYNGTHSKIRRHFQTTTQPWIMCDCYLSMNVSLN